MIPLERFLKSSQEKLYKDIRSWLKVQRVKYYYCKNKYILAKGDAQVMLVAHLDTVHKKTVEHICKTDDGNILMSPQGIGGDDRCGVYALVNAYEMSTVKPWLLFTCDEEVGGVGADAFCLAYRNKQLPQVLKDLKFIIEIDRKGKNDAVYYDCDNKDFEDYITSKGFETQFGSFSDISCVAPEIGVAAVNLSSGYYNAHQTHEYIVRSEIDDVIDKVVQMISESVKDDFPQYEYVEKPRVYSPVGFRTTGYDYYGSFLPANLPAKYHMYYDELLFAYSKDELETIRSKLGNEVLEELFIMEQEGIDTRAEYFGCVDNDKEVM